MLRRAAWMRWLVPRVTLSAFMRSTSGVFGRAAGDEHIVREAAEQLHRALKHVLAVAVNRETKLVPPHAGRQATRHDYSVHDASQAVPLKGMGMR